MMGRKKADPAPVGSTDEGNRAMLQVAYDEAKAAHAARIGPIDAELAAATAAYEAACVRHSEEFADAEDQFREDLINRGVYDSKGKFVRDDLQ